MPVTPPSPTRAARRLAPAVLGVLVTATVLAGCQPASSGAEAAAAAPSGSAAPGGQATGAPGVGANGPGGGTSGEVVQVGDATMQVRGADEQTTVTWTSTTTFTRSVAGSLDDVVVGACVVAFGAADDGAATSVTVSDPVDGACTGGPGGRGPGDGTRPSGAPTGMPGGMPTDLPSGAPDGGTPGQRPSGGPGGGFGSVVAGRVTAVDGTTLTVATTQGDDEGSASVTVSSATAWTTTATASASAVEKGLCASVRGEADDSGAVAATSVSLSEPGDDGCSTALRGGFPGGRGGPGQQGGPQDGQDGSQAADDQGGTDA